MNMFFSKICAGIGLMFIEYLIINLLMWLISLFLSWFGIIITLPISIIYTLYFAGGMIFQRIWDVEIND